MSTAALLQLPSRNPLQFRTVAVPDAATLAVGNLSHGERCATTLDRGERSCFRTLAKTNPRLGYKGIYYYYYYYYYSGAFFNYINI